MTILSSRASTADPEFQLNRSAYEALIARLHERRRKALAGGPPKAREKHLARNKILPRDRVEVLLDPGSPFLELGMLAGEGVQQRELGHDAVCGENAAFVHRNSGAAAVFLGVAQQGG